MNESESTEAKPHKLVGHLDIGGIVTIEADGKRLKLQIPNGESLRIPAGTLIESQNVR